MKKQGRSRAYDPTYKPEKTYQQLAKEYPGNPGIQMMADREQKLLAAARLQGRQDSP